MVLLAADGWRTRRSPGRWACRMYPQAGLAEPTPAKCWRSPTFRPG